MKHLLILLSICCLVSCKTQKNEISKHTNCPENGTCSFEKHENQSLIVQKDDIGGLYYQMEEIQGKNVFIFRYNRNKKENLIDGHYTEEILFEVDNSAFEKSFTNIEPEKSLFGVFCYCKGKAGYYLPENISISFDQKTEVITITIEELVENQVLRTFAFAK